jgi:hypothetical protein
MIVALSFFSYKLLPTFAVADARGVEVKFGAGLPARFLDLWTYTDR